MPYPLLVSILISFCFMGKEFTVNIWTDFKAASIEKPEARDLQI